MRTVHVNGLSEDAPPTPRSTTFSCLAVLCFAGACCLPILVPSVHLYAFSLLWRDYEFKVDRQTCRCPCWDTIFKGPYESDEAAYKHIYFNVTLNSFKIWTVTVIYILAFYEVGKRLIRLALQRQIRWPMLVLLAFGAYPNYYCWWSYFNYWNDDYYTQWYHQLYFSITEFISTFYVFQLLDAKRVPQPLELLVILTVAGTHVSASLYDQFLTNVLAGRGSLHQVLRDIGLMTPDLLHLWIPWRELRKQSRHLKTLYTSAELTVVTVFVLSSWLYIFLV